MVVTNDLKDISKENWLSLLNKFEMSALENYLFSLNQNINWNTILEKNLETNNEKFIKQIKSLIWEDHPSGILTDDYFEDNYVLIHGIKIKNTFDHLSFLFDNINFDEIIKILKPNLDYPLPEIIYEYYNKIINEYNFFFKMFHIKYQYIEQEENNCILLGYLTKKINYNQTMKLNYDFPIKYDLSDNYNKLIMLIFVNINSDIFDFNDYKYNFLNLKL